MSTWKEINLNETQVKSYLKDNRLEFSYNSKNNTQKNSIYKCIECSYL